MAEPSFTPKTSFQHYAATAWVAKVLSKAPVKLIIHPLEQTRFDVAKSMASRGYSIREIYNTTGLSIADVKQLLD